MYKTKITIRGTVQHVGLRVQIKAIADGLGVCGTVENLRDGSVLVSCEAGRADIEEMVRQIRSGTEFAVIKDVLVEEGPPATGMEGFEVIRGDSSEEMLSMMATRTKTMFGVLATLKDMKQGQNQTNETLTEMKQGQAGEGPRRSEAGPGRDDRCDKVRGRQAGRVTGERRPKP